MKKTVKKSKKASKKSKKPVRVVYNSCFGGFGLSQKAVERLAELGVEAAKERLANPPSMKILDSYCDPQMLRHDPCLVQVVEELGEEASGELARLKITTLKGRKYRIEEYDGIESVFEPEELSWIVVE